MLLLTLHTFSLTGGIERMAKVLTKIFHDSHTQGIFKKFKSLSLYDTEDDIDIRFCDKKSFVGFKGNKIRFCISVLSSGFKSDTIFLTHINLLLPVMITAMLAKKKRIILLAHGIEVWEPLSSWKRHFINKHVEVWAVSRFTAAKFQQINRIHSSQIRILNNCIDPFFQYPTNFIKPPYLLKRYSLNPTQPVLLVINRLSSKEQYKGYDKVILAVHRLIESFPTIKYLIAGKADKEELERLNSIIYSAKLENHVQIIDFINEDELVDHFLLADLFVMPSNQEGFGLVFIEAAACGCPSVAGNSDGSSDALLNGSLGCMVNPDNIDDIVENISAELRGKSVNKRLIQKLCRKHFSFEVYQQIVLKILNSSNN